MTTFFLLHFCTFRALALYGLSAGQGNSEAYLRLGDIFYYGLAGLERDKQEAAYYYQHAADLRHTHAIFNLGIMHEVGDGVTQDFHLAKRFYDQAAEFDMEAKLPRSVALALLQSHRYLYSKLGSEMVDYIVLSWLIPMFAVPGGEVVRTTIAILDDAWLFVTGGSGGRTSSSGKGRKTSIKQGMKGSANDIFTPTDALRSLHMLLKRHTPFSAKIHKAYMCGMSAFTISIRALSSVFSSSSASSSISSVPISFSEELKFDTFLILLLVVTLFALFKFKAAITRSRERRRRREVTE